MSMLSLVERLMRTHHPELAALGETSEPAEGESGGDGGGEATGGGDGGGGGGDVQCGVCAEGEGGACEAICPDLPACHVVDLCCGRSLTVPCSSSKKCAGRAARFGRAHAPRSAASAAWRLAQASAARLGSRRSCGVDCLRLSGGAHRTPSPPLLHHRDRPRAAMRAAALRHLAPVPARVRRTTTSHRTDQQPSAPRAPHAFG